MFFYSLMTSMVNNNNPLHKYSIIFRELYTVYPNSFDK